MISPVALPPKAPPLPEAPPAAVEPLIEELISIGHQSKTIAQADGTVFSGRMERARASGQSLNEPGGLALMRQAHQRVIAEVHYPGAARELDSFWHRISH